jgi:hypothetical protein
MPFGRKLVEMRNHSAVWALRFLGEIPMLHLEDLGHSDPIQCEELVKNFARLEDPAVREKVLNLLKDLATNNGELLSPDDLITIS